MGQPEPQQPTASKEAAGKPGAKEASDASGAFKALLAAWSLVVITVTVAGFSYRWTYLYNFGLQNLVLEGPISAVPIYAIELLRTPESLSLLLRLLLALLIPFQVALMAVQWAARHPRRKISAAGRFLMRLSGLDSLLVVDAVRAGILIYVAFLSGGQAGHQRYRVNVDESTSPLPKATIMLTSSKADASLAATCDAQQAQGGKPANAPPFVGDATTVKLLLNGGACSLPGRSWRLLFRNEKFTYLFATVQDPDVRPDTLAVPNTDKSSLVLN